MNDSDEINYKDLNEEEMSALNMIESGKMMEEPTAAQVIKDQFGGDAKKYLKVMGAV